MKKSFGIFLLIGLMLVAETASALVNSSTLNGRKNRMDRVCWEIGRTARYPSMCKNPTSVNYRGILCWGCPEATHCRPGCTGGKVCINQKCVCPPNQLLYDCHGRCITPETPCTK